MVDNQVNVATQPTLSKLILVNIGSVDVTPPSKMLAQLLAKPLEKFASFCAAAKSARAAQTKVLS